MAAKFAVFLSYSREDERGSGGRISALAEAVANEFSLLTGSPLELFLDRKDIHWGDAWRQRISDALDTGTILIPVITPRYFLRPECRREFQEFYGQAAAMDAVKLILPVRFAAIEDFSEANADELVAIASRLNYADWADLRLADFNGEQVRRAVNAMAVRVDSVLKAVRKVQEQAQPILSRDVPADDGVLDVLARIEAILPEWRELVDEGELTEAQFEAVDKTMFARHRRATSPSQSLAIRHQEAKAETPIAMQMLSLSQMYYRRTLELHPLVSSMLRLVREYPEHVSLVADLSDAVTAAMTQIGSDRTASPNRRYIGAVEYWSEYAHLGRLMKELLGLHQESRRFRMEANELVKSWASELASLGA